MGNKDKVILIAPSILSADFTRLAAEIADVEKAGADWITIHVEATKEVEKTLEEIRRLGAKPGISLRPKTPLSKIEPYLDLGLADLVLVMTVEPGFGGQAFMPEMLEKVKKLKARFRVLVSVDGGINKKTAPAALEAGADILVAGTAIFGEPDRASAIKNLRVG